MYIIEQTCPMYGSGSGMNSWYSYSVLNWFYIAPCHSKTSAFDFRSRSRSPSLKKSRFSSSRSRSESRSPSRDRSSSDSSDTEDERPRLRGSVAVQKAQSPKVSAMLIVRNQIFLSLKHNCRIHRTCTLCGPSTSSLTFCQSANLIPTGG